jgi:hypothetical protein
MSEAAIQRDIVRTLRLSPSTEHLRKLMRYDPKTGKLFWRPRTPDMFRDVGKPAELSCATWNTRYADKEAGAKRPDGYLVMAIDGRSHRAHRLIWQIYHGHPPDQDIDHINGVKDDNRICNLRDVSNSVNGRNRKRQENNSSGYTGVNFHKQTQKWRAFIKVNQKQKELGKFNSISEAISARKNAEPDLGFTSRHGVAS